jgi:hypothetical protein
MKLLEPYVNHYVNCPFYSEEKILRSGVPMNGSCFFLFFVLWIQNIS